MAADHNGLDAHAIDQVTQRNRGNFPQKFAAEFSVVAAAVAGGRSQRPAAGDNGSYNFGLWNN